MPWARAGSRVPITIAGWLRSAVRTWEVIRALPPGSVCVVMCPPVFAPITAVAAARGRGVRVVVDAHSGTFNDRRWLWSHRLVRWVLQRAALVLVTNVSVLTGFELVRCRALVAHDPLDSASRNAPPPLPHLPTRSYVVFPTSGAADEPLAAVTAAADLLGGRPIVVITGRGSERLQHPNVIGTGFLDAASYVAVLCNAAAVLALTGREGTMQRAAYEAVEAGIPVVCSDTHVLREALDGAGVFCRNDAESIAAGIRAAVGIDPRSAARAARTVRSRLAASVDDARTAIAALMGARGQVGRDGPPAVSIVIDNYNYARFLGRSVDSALGQTYRHIEVIVVDDGSTDDSLEVLRSYGNQVKVCARENGGQAAALNTGFLASSGDIVMFLDADDELYPRAVDRVVSAMTQANGSVAKVHFRLDSVDADGNHLGFTNPTRRSRLASGNLTQRVVRRGRYVTPVMSGNAYPRRVLEQILPIPEEAFRISADGYLVTLAAIHGAVVAIDESLGAYRIHGNNAWASQGIDEARFRALIDHDFARYRGLAAATGTDARAVDVMALRDQNHLRSRLASLRLDPGGHPLPRDRRMGLMSAGVRTALTTPGMSARQRITFAAWFPVVAFAPKPLARRAAHLLHAPQERYHIGKHKAGHPVSAATPDRSRPNGARSFRRSHAQHAQQTSAQESST